MTLLSAAKTVAEWAGTALDMWISEYFVLSHDDERQDADRMREQASAFEAAIRATEERQEKCDHENRRLIRNSGQLLGGPGDYRVTDNQCCPKCGKSLIEKETEEVKA